MKALVLKTSVRESVPWVRIPPSPPITALFSILNALVSGKISQYFTERCANRSKKRTEKRTVGFALRSESFAGCL